MDRSTAGVLQRLLEMYGHRSLEVADLLSSTGVVRALNPIEYTVDVARARSELDCNLLAAEVVAAARSEDAVVRLAPSNAQGQLRKALIKASVAGAIWRFEPSRAGLAVVEEALAVQ